MFRTLSERGFDVKFGDLDCSKHHSICGQEDVTDPQSAEITKHFRMYCNGVRQPLEMSTEPFPDFPMVDVNEDGAISHAEWQKLKGAEGARQNTFKGILSALSVAQH